MFPMPVLAVDHPVVRDAFAFVAAACGEPSLRRALARAGYGPWDQRQGCSLLRSASMFVRSGAPERHDAIAEILSWVVRNMRVGRAALLVLDPEAAGPEEPVIRAEDAVARAEFDLEFLDAVDDALGPGVAPRERPDRDRIRFLLFFAKENEPLTPAGGAQETPIEALEAWHRFWLAEAASQLRPRGRRTRGRGRTGRSKANRGEQASVPETVRSPSRDADATAPTDRATTATTTVDVNDKEES